MRYEIYLNSDKIIDADIIKKIEKEFEEEKVNRPNLSRSKFLREILIKFLNTDNNNNSEIRVNSIDTIKQNPPESDVHETPLEDFPRSETGISSDAKSLMSSLNLNV